jgi:TorA maturation chaperone TorD
MRNPESVYINLGHLFEKAPNPERAREVHWAIRAKLAQEDTEEDKAEARRLVERGRQEARSERR